MIEQNIVQTSPRSLVVKASAWGLGGREFESRPRPRQTKVLKMGTLAAVSLGVGIMRLVSGLVGPVSVYCDWVGHSSCARLNVPVWHHANKCPTSTVLI